LVLIITRRDISVHQSTRMAPPTQQLVI